MQGIDALQKLCSRKRGIDFHTLESVLYLAVEIAREGREGRKIGTLFVIADSDEVMRLSTNLILDPLAYHPPDKKHIDAIDLRETIKELAQLDGAFIINAQGIVCSACRYINASAHNIDLPLGLGSRHVAAASITQQTNAVAVVVSESSVVRIFAEGAIVVEIIPELWLLSCYNMQNNAALNGHAQTEQPQMDQQA